MCTTCSIQTMATPSARIPAIVCRSTAASASVRPAPISSSSSSRGRVARARAISSRLRSSRPRLSARRLATRSRPHASSTSVHVSQAACPPRRPPALAPTNTFSNTVMPVNGLGTWWARPMPSRQRLSALARVTSAPAKRTVPPSARSEPEMMLRSVVLPAPLGPTMPTASPSLTTKSTPSITVKAPKRLRTPTASTSAADACSTMSCMEPAWLPPGCSGRPNSRRNGTRAATSCP